MSRHPFDEDYNEPPRRSLFPVPDEAAPPSDSTDLARHLVLTERGPVMEFDPAWMPARFEEEYRALGPNSLRHWNPVVLARFCALLACLGRESSAARAVGLSPMVISAAKKQLPSFQEAAQEAYSEFCDRLHSEAFRRAVDGWNEPVFYQGAVVGYIKRKSDRILELMLKAHMPEKFGDKVDVNANVTGGVLLVPAGQSVEDWTRQYTGATLEATATEVVSG